MGRPKKNERTELMRVPTKFKEEIVKLAPKYGYKDRTLFLEKEGIKVLQNADYLNDLIFVFRRRKK